jgi:hypothetical protein
MERFFIGDMVKLNVDHPIWYMKKGKIVAQSKDQEDHFIVCIETNGKKEHAQVAGYQLILINKDPSFNKFMTETLPELIKQGKPAVDVDNDDSNVLEQPPPPKPQQSETYEVQRSAVQNGIKEAFTLGYQQGYVAGYQACSDDIKSLMIANGLIQKKEEGK